MRDRAPWTSHCEIGDIVGCVEDFAGPHAENKPVRGDAYTIRAMHRDENGVFFLLKEVINEPKQNCIEPDFHSSGFLPLKGKCASGDVAYNLKRDFASAAFPPQPYEGE
jgi:hypothetical protein